MGVQSTCGVRSGRLSRFGRHLPDYMASSLSVLSNLDASSVNMWRPFCTPIMFWTPLARLHGVRSARLSRFGRQPLSQMASIPAALLNLDASRTHRRRPIYALIAIWTPPTQSHGVRSARLSRFGRHLPDYMASAPHNFPVLDATQTSHWRPFRTASPIWTPPKLPTGVHSAHLPQSGRHPNFPLASIPHSFPNLDATQTSH